MPVLLALHLLRRDDPNEPHTMGFDLRRPWQDLWRGALLAAAIGLPGLALYAAAKALDLNTTIAAANLAGAWWTVPVLVLAAAQNAVLEEVIMVGYLFSRWGSVGWGKWRIIVTSALIRGSYHLYQGFGGFVGNVVMGVDLRLVLHAHQTGHAAGRRAHHPRRRGLRRLRAAQGPPRPGSDPSPWRPGGRPGTPPERREARRIMGGGPHVQRSPGIRLNFLARCENLHLRTATVPVSCARTCLTVMCQDIADT